MLLLPTDQWEIKTTKKKGRGVFAAKDIKPGTVIGDYIGKVIRTAVDDTSEADKGLYLMYYHDYASLLPEDINAPGIHLVNHACTPNAWIYTYKGHTLIFALRHIFKGEEVTISYLLSPADCSPCKHTCTCESVICSGTMHLSQKKFEAWNEVRLKLSAQTKRKRISYGKKLTMLNAYPENIPDHPIYTLFGAKHMPPLNLDRTEIPTVPEIRKLIRESGRTIHLSKINKIIMGVQQNEIIPQ